MSLGFLHGTAGPMAGGEVPISVATA